MPTDSTVNFEVVTPPSEGSSPLLCHVPHSATAIPARWRAELVLDDEALRRERVAMTDHCTEDLFVPAAQRAGGVAFVNRVSRLVCDPERFEDDAREEMSRKGMGAVYTLTSSGEPLRAPGYSRAEREVVISELFRPYAEALERQVAMQLERFGRCLIIDAHSFPARALPYEDASRARPDLCLGTDGHHTPAPLQRALEQAAVAAGWEVAINEPFAGSYVPTRWFGRDTRVASVMLEVNRRLYLDERTGEPGPGFAETQSILDGLVERALLFEAFRNTTFVAFGVEGEIPIVVGEACAAVDWGLETHSVHEWAFITAFNPDGEALPSQENQSAHARLASELGALGVEVLPGEGRGDVGDWPPEPSFLVLGISEAEAAALGRRYGQAAIVVGRRGEEARLLVL